MSTFWLRDTLPFATVAAAARFVPVPFMDDVIKSAAVRGALVRLLTSRESSFPASHLKPLYDSGSFLGALFRFPLKLLLFPIRKLVKLISAVRGVPRDFLEVFLLMRTVDSVLDSGVFDVDSKRERRKKAKRVRKAFDRAFKSADLKLLSAALGDALEHSKVLGNFAMQAAASFLGAGDVPAGADEDATHEAAPVERDEFNPSSEDTEQLLHEVESTLRRSDIEASLEAFDERFREALATALA